jgi:hypothetical protein
MKVLVIPGVPELQQELVLAAQMSFDLGHCQVRLVEDFDCPLGLVHIAL